MIKNSRLVFSMSLEQRIKLITSAELYKSRSLDEYGFPAIDFSANPTYNKQKKATDFPSDLTLACAFDEGIVKRIYGYVGNEAKACAPFAYYDVDNSEDGTIDGFILGKLAAGKVSGLNSAGAFVNFNDMTNEECSVYEHLNYKLVADAVTGEGTPNSVVIRSADYIDKYKKYAQNGLLFGVAKNKEEVARYINGGCSFVFLEEDFTDELVTYLVELTEEYKRAEGARTRGKITSEKIKLCRDELTMLPEARINEACGEVIQTLVELSNNNKDAIAESKISLGSEEASFNEPLHDAAALEGARRSVVMIKNDGVLPLDYQNNVAVLGEYAKSGAYHGSGNKQTVRYLPFDVINDYDIQTVGFAYGYRDGQPFNNESWQTAGSLCRKADVTLVYLCARPGEHVLPEEQLNLLSALSKINTKVIAIVASDSKIDMGFVSLCSAVLLTHRGGQKTADAVFEILTGYTAPSGKLPYSVSAEVDIDGTESGEVIFPVGYGLSYTSFEYRNLAINEGGISLTVTNTGNYDGCATVLMYVNRESEGKVDDGYRRLRGYKKIFVPKHGTEKIDIPFGEETFRTYDYEKSQYLVEGGKYVVTVGETQTDIRLQGEVTLRPYVYDEKNSESRQKERADGKKIFPEFADTQDKRAYFVRRTAAPIGVRIVLAILAALYFDVMFVLMAIGGLFPETLITYITVGGVLAIINIGLLIFCIVTAKRHKVLKSQSVLIGEDTVAKLNDFKELAFISYETPITPEQLEAEIEDEEEVGEQVEEINEDTPVYSYDTGFTEGVSSKIAFKSGVSFKEICSNFHDYALGFGIEVAPSSVRALFAAIASDKIIFLRINHKEIQPEFIKVLLGYFQCENSVEASQDWKTPSDLYWKLAGDRYVASGFVNALYNAQRTPDKNAVAVINNVDPERVSDWLKDFIRFALYPSEKHILKLNDSTQTEIPHNLCCLLVTDSDCANIAPNVAAASAQVHIGISKANPSEQVEVKNVSFNSFNDSVRDSREEYFLPEIYWKKLDELVEAINATERFGIGNKILLQLEKFTSVIIACGADNGEAFTKMFVAKVVPLLKKLSMYKADGGDKTVYGIIEKLYGDENLTKIRRALIRSASALTDETVKTKTPAENEPHKVEAAVSDEPAKVETPVVEESVKAKASVAGAPAKAKAAVADAPAKAKASVANEPVRVEAQVADARTKIKASVADAPVKAETYESMIKDSGQPKNSTEDI